MLTDPEDEKKPIKTDYPPAVKEMIKQVLQNLKDRNWMPPPGNYGRVQGLTCTCEGMLPDPNCECHRMIR